MKEEAIILAGKIIDFHIERAKYKSLSDALRHVIDIKKDITLNLLFVK